MITPAVTTDRTPQQGASATSGLSFAGQRARSNNITVDGVDNNDAAVGAVRATFSQEAVREFQVLTNWYSAEFGKASGGVVNIVTRSGTNTARGKPVRVLQRRDAQPEGAFREVRSLGLPQSIAKRRSYGQKQYWRSRWAVPSGGTGLFTFVSFERLDIDTNNFVNIDDTTPGHARCYAARNTANRSCERAGFPDETGNVPYEIRGNQFLAQGRSPADTGTEPRRCDSTMRTRSTRTSNPGVVKSRGVVARRSTVGDYMLAASNTGVHGTSFVNELRFQYARRDQDVNSLDPRCGGRARSSTKADRRSRSPALRASAGSASRRSPDTTGESSCSTLSASSWVITSSRRDSTSAPSTTTTRRCRFTSGAATSLLPRSRARRSDSPSRRSTRFKQFRWGCRRPTCRDTATR